MTDPADPTRLAERTRAVAAFCHHANGSVRAGDVAAVFGPDAYTYLRRLTAYGLLIRTGRGRYITRKDPL